MRGMRVLLIALTAVAVATLPLTFMPDRWAVILGLFILPLVGAMAFGGGVYFVMAFARFLKRKPTVRIDATVHDGQVRIECWESPGRKSELDSLLEKVQKLQKRVDELVPYPVEVSFHLFHMKPLRVSLLQAVAITLILYLPVRWLASYADMPYLYIFLLLPALGYLGLHGIERLQMLMEPKLFREALANYEEEELDEAAIKLRNVLANDPSHLPALVLYAQTATLQGDFRAAFDSCDRIDAMDDELGESLRDEILAVERLHKRMDEEIS